jgi:RNA polymerase sigma factor for flagellar operon FliA
MQHRCISKSRRPASAPAEAQVSLKQQLVLDHLFLVGPIAGSIRAKLPVHVESEDLIHDGICGLIEAAERFDATRSVPFAVYAKHRIRGAILDGLRRLDPASRDVRAKAKRIDAAARDLANRLGRDPTTAEIADESGISLRQFTRLCASIAASATALAPDGDSGIECANFTTNESLNTEAVVAREELREALLAAMKTLPNRDRQIVMLHHWRAVSMREIGGLFNINESRVSQIHKRALARMAVRLRAIGIASSDAFSLP